jgi:hypothetical protein
MARLSAEKAIESFEEVARSSLSSVDWASAEIGQRLLPTHFDEQTDQGCRGPKLRTLIVDWMEYVGGPLARRRVLDLFSGRGACVHAAMQRGAHSYLGIDINPVIASAARVAAPAGASFLCEDALSFASRSDLRSYGVILLLYECLNAVGNEASGQFFRTLHRKCAAGTWVFGDVRLPNNGGYINHRIAGDCPYLDPIENGYVIDEHGVVGNIFGHRYVAIDAAGSRVTAQAHSMLELIGKNQIESMLLGAGFKEVVFGSPLLNIATDVPECSGNVFFAACS